MSNIVPLLGAALNVVPVAVTAAESIETLRNWASGRCLDATKSGIYQHRQKLPQHLSTKSWRNHGTSHGDGALVPPV